MRARFLAKGCTLDLRAAAFRAPHCAQTLLARTQMLLQAVDDSPVFRIFVRPSSPHTWRNGCSMPAAETRASKGFDAERISARLDLAPYTHRMATRKISMTTSPVSLRPTVMGRSHAVSTGHYLATLAAMRVLDAGGNAVDAGVTAAMALAVLQPDIVGFAASRRRSCTWRRKAASSRSRAWATGRRLPIPRASPPKATAQTFPRDCCAP
jgi:hypothetical protein